MSAAKLVDTGASFIQESNDVAFCFLELYFEDPKNNPEGVSITKRSPAPPRRIATDSAEYVVTGAAGPPPPHNEDTAIRVSLSTEVDYRTV